MGRAVDETEGSRPRATADVTFLPPEQGGRRTPPILTCQYIPHIEVQSSDIRHVKAGQDGFCRESYLGVCFVAAPQDVRPGVLVTVNEGTTATCPPDPIVLLLVPPTVKKFVWPVPPTPPNYSATCEMTFAGEGESRAIAKQRM